MPDPSKSHPGFPSRKESAQIFRVHGLLYEEVHLPSHTEHCSLLNTFQLLLKSHQNTLSHLVKTLVVTAGRIKNRKTGAVGLDPEQHEQHPVRKPKSKATVQQEEGKKKILHLAFLLGSCGSVPSAELMSASSSGLCCKYKAFKGFMVQSKSGS